MRYAAILPVFLALCLGAVQDADARPSRARVGIYYGIGWSPFWYPAPWPYYPPPVIIATPPAPPPVYIEQAKPAPTAAEYWYYCRSGGGYYPVVNACPEGWLPVLPELPEVSPPAPAAPPPSQQ